jgi:hypothetical protein
MADSIPLGVGAAESPIASRSDVDAVYFKIAQRIIPFLAVLFLMNWLDRNNVGFAKLQMVKDLRFSYDRRGLRREERSDDWAAFGCAVYRGVDWDDAGRPSFRPDAGTSMPCRSCVGYLRLWPHWDRRTCNQPGFGLRCPGCGGNWLAQWVDRVLANTAYGTGGQGRRRRNRADQLAGLPLGLGWAIDSWVA